ncbi:MAG: amino acid adenylation domain-containing protein [Legionella sp.]|uniref:amino acid adenylation domain-containing protein n=1 Tax=Legionella sp. TaxID=459 RepID=UPI00284A05D4|nr:amino acid adenylation domain-containing protein [Legionella sp.]
MERVNIPQSMEQLLKPIELQDYYKIAKFDLSLFVDDDDGRSTLKGIISGATSLFHHETIRRLALYYQIVLEKMSEDLDIMTSDCHILSPEEYNKIVYEWNETEQIYPFDKPVHKLFEEQVERTPDKLAVIYKEQLLNYQQLNEQANQLAHYLQSLGIKPETHVAISMDISIEMIIGLMGILKSGGAFVPFDPNLPKQRLQALLNETNVRFIITQSFLNEKFSDCNIICINLDHKNLFIEEKNTNIERCVSGNNLAYIMYTSGSTGHPKGVEIEHHSLTNLCVYCKNQFNLNIDETDRVSVYAKFGYDGFASEVFPYLIYGASLHIVPADIRYDPERLNNWMHQQQITTASLPTKMAEEFFNKPNETLRVIHTSGELLKKVHSNKYKIINNYGPTEGTILTTSYLIEKSENLLIGKPISNVKVYILNNNLYPNPIGVVGELYIGGVGLARGYLNSPELTKEKFIPNPFVTAEDLNENRNLKLYKTGDLARYLSDGNIEIIGRIDEQVKIRGYRIELPEIEQALSTYDGIFQSVVLAKERTLPQGNIKCLVAYYVSKQFINEDILRDHLSKYLPDYMIPISFVFMANLPLTRNGKLDKKRLPSPDFSIKDIPFIAPETDLERKMCFIWQTVLGINQVGVTDDFFRLGGDSISGMQLTARMNQSLKMNISISDIFSQKTILNIVNSCVGDRNKNPLIKKLHTKNHFLPIIYFVHPASSGCEVYQSLADLLDCQFQSIGVDNYNLNNKEKIDNLAEISNYYIQEINQLFPFSQEIFLCGWSLGGQIALEMAYKLEQKGFNKINVFLLDTVLYYDESLRDIIATFDNNPYEEFKNYLLRQNLDEQYVERMCEAYNAEVSISYNEISGRLINTKITLFKALEINNTFSDAHHLRLEKYKCLIEDNNIQKVSAQKIKVVTLDCHHGNIMKKANEIKKIILESV